LQIEDFSLQVELQLPALVPLDFPPVVLCPYRPVTCSLVASDIAPAT